MGNNDIGNDISMLFELHKLEYIVTVMMHLSQNKGSWLRKKNFLNADYTKRTKTIDCMKDYAPMVHEIFMQFPQERLQLEFRRILEDDGAAALLNSMIYPGS